MIYNSTTRQAVRIFVLTVGLLLIMILLMSGGG
jgi:hypothetical protein